MKNIYNFLQKKTCYFEKMWYLCRVDDGNLVKDMLKKESNLAILGVCVYTHLIKN